MNVRMLAHRESARPAVQRIPTAKLELFQMRGFAPTALCAALVALIDRDRHPSTLADAGDDRYFRTSETCDLPPDDPAVIHIEALLGEVSGIDPAYGEPLQGQRYAAGQEFKPHCDYFNRESPEWDRYCADAGQRTWTFMVYLGEVEAGGATRFKAIDKIIQPETGKLVFWNNLLPDGRVNHATIHQGMKVRRGTKHVLTKWYREKPWV